MEVVNYTWYIFVFGARKPFQKYAQAIATTNLQGKMSKNIKNGLLVAENHYLLSKPRSAAGGFSMVYIVYLQGHF